MSKTVRDRSNGKMQPRCGKIWEKQSTVGGIVWKNTEHCGRENEASQKTGLEKFWQEVIQTQTEAEA